MSNEVKHQQNKENSQINNKLKVLCKVEFSCYKDTSSCLNSTQTIVWDFNSFAIDAKWGLLVLDSDLPSRIDKIKGKES